MNETESNDIISRYCDSLLLNNTVEDSWNIPVTTEDIAYSTVYSVLFTLGIIANLIVIVTL